MKLRRHNYQYSNGRITQKTISSKKSSRNGRRFDATLLSEDAIH